ncbi:MAG: DMT family transporter [Rhizobiaceae bacterium]
MQREIIDATRAGHKSPRKIVGVVLIALSALAASSSGLLVRLISDSDSWQILAWRSLAFAGMFFILLSWRYGHRMGEAFRALGWSGFAGAVCLGLTFVAYLTAMFLTSISAAVTIFSVSPFLVGILSAVLLREYPHPGNWLWMALALSGVAYMMAQDTGSSIGFPRSNIGMLSALIATTGYALTIVMLRGKRDIDLTAGFVVAGVVSFCISATIAESLLIPPADLSIAIALGLLSLGLHYHLLQMAARHLQADELSLLALLEIFLSPLWVWIAVGEIPARATFIGGSIVLAALVGISTRGLGTKASATQPRKKWRYKGWE